MLKNTLRLLLIIDYIFDWARDIYRNIIIDELLALADNVTPSLLDDWDSMSTVPRQTELVAFNHNVQPELQASSSTDEHGVNDFLKFFDLTRDLGIGCGVDGVIRDGSIMEHLFYGIEITTDTIDDVMKSFKVNEYRDFARKLQSDLSKQAWLVTGEALDEVEKLWTGHDREYTIFRNPYEKFIVKFAVSSFFKEMSSNIGQDRGIGWDQVHNLTYIAVAEEAIDRLREITDLKRGWTLDHHESLVMDKEALKDFFRPIRHASVCKCLAAASSMVEMVTGTKVLTAKSKLAAVLEREDNSRIAQIPPRAYHRLTGGGQLEPQASFLHVSRHIGSQSALQAHHSYWPGIRHATTQAGSVVLAYDLRPAASFSTRLCIFYVDDLQRERCKSHRQHPDADKLPNYINPTIIRVKQALVFTQAKVDRTKPDFSEFMRLFNAIETRCNELEALGNQKASRDMSFWFSRRYDALKKASWWSLGYPETIEFLKEQREAHHLTKMFRDMRHTLEQLDPSNGPKLKKKALPRSAELRVDKGSSSSLKRVTDEEEEDERRSPRKRLQSIREVREQLAEISESEYLRLPASRRVLQDPRNRDYQRLMKTHRGVTEHVAALSWAETRRKSHR